MKELSTEPIHTADDPVGEDAMTPASERAWAAQERRKVARLALEAQHVERRARLASWAHRMHRDSSVVILAGIVLLMVTGWVTGTVWMGGLFSLASFVYGIFGVWANWKPGCRWCEKER